MITVRATDVAALGQCLGIDESKLRFSTCNAPFFYK